MALSAEPAVPAFPCNSHGPSLRVLIVEDDLDSAETEALLVRVDGHAVRLARDGPTALRQVREWAPDVVLLDLGLPGMDGYQVGQAVAAMQLRKRPFVIAVTGFGTPDDCHRSREAGIDLHLVKPVDPGYLLQLLKRFRLVVAE